MDFAPLSAVINREEGTFRQAGNLVDPEQVVHPIRDVVRRRSFELHISIACTKDAYIHQTQLSSSDTESQMVALMPGAPINSPLTAPVEESRSSCSARFRTRPSKSSPKAQGPTNQRMAGRLRDPHA